jgi:hypothetical protein
MFSQDTKSLPKVSLLRILLGNNGLLLFVAKAQHLSPRDQCGWQNDFALQIKPQGRQDYANNRIRLRDGGD